MTDRKLYFSSGSGSSYSLGTRSKFIPKFNTDSYYNGFTIIEVALVLAIAGLIFLVVFLALPALQNSQKDTARREDVGRVISALQSYETDNGGDLSGFVTDDWQNATSSGLDPYIGNLGAEIAGTYVAPVNNDPISGAGQDDDINIFVGSDCQGNTNLSASHAAVTVRVANETQLYCQDI